MPRRWTLHGLNNGAIFGATYRGVAKIPRWASYGIARSGSWIAWRLLHDTRAAIADNLRAVFPDEPPASLERRALATIRAYTLDVVDFIRALTAPDDRVDAHFDFRGEDQQLFVELLAQGRGIILVTGHYGNWEAGGVFLGRVAKLPLTIVAMPEADTAVDQLRQEIRERIGAETVHVGRSIDTALQIRRQLADNRIVAMLMDRHIGRDRVAVTLFGRRAYFLQAPLLMGFMTRAPLVPCFLERQGPGRFIVRPGRPILVADGGRRDEAIAAAAQDFAAQLEERVRQHPEFWYHFYRYWDAQQE